MNDVPTFARVRGSVIGVLGFAALVAGCEGKMPTAAEVERMDVASASSRLGTDSAAIYIVNRKLVTKTEAMGLKPEQISAIEVVKRAGSSEPAKILITTRDAEGIVAIVPDERTSKAAPLMILNGVTVDESVIKGIDRKDIESVEVIKGKAAMKQYGERGKNGVVLIVTKRGAREN
jgi:TonB-dependent SusC/RagA subfamily outer membrane receptor